MFAVRSLTGSRVPGTKIWGSNPLTPPFRNKHKSILSMASRIRGAVFPLIHVCCAQLDRQQSSRDKADEGNSGVGCLTCTIVQVRLYNEPSDEREAGIQTKVLLVEQVQLCNEHSDGRVRLPYQALAMWTKAQFHLDLLTVHIFHK